MKKLLLILLLSCTALFSQGNASAIKLGLFSPSAAETGFIIGYEWGRYIDEALNIGWSLDWFNKTYTDKKLVGQFNEYYGINGTINELRAKTTIHDFPLMFNVTGKIPAGPRTQVFITGGIGGELLLINYRHFSNPDETETKGAVDFNWRLGAGMLYELGRRSDVFGEISYHSSQPSWQYEVEGSDGRKRTFERNYDMSGLMFRVGVRFYY